MTKTQIKEQLDAIKKTTKTATKSKDTALRFLEESGIIKKQKKTSR